MLKGDLFLKWTQQLKQEWAQRDTAPETFGRRPLAVMLFWAAECLVMGKSTLEVSQFLRASGFQNPPSLWAFGCLGVGFGLMGCVTFFMYAPASWVLWFVGHFCVILHLGSQALVQAPGGVSLGWGDLLLLGAQGVLDIMGLIFLNIPLFRTYLTQPHLHLWKRSHRMDWNEEARLCYLNKTMPCIVLNLSETGCLLRAQRPIPLGERLSIEMVNHADLRLVAEVMRVTPPAPAEPPQTKPLEAEGNKEASVPPEHTYLYGCRFLKPVKKTDLLQWGQRSPSGPP